MLLSFQIHVIRRNTLHLTRLFTSFTCGAMYGAVKQQTEGPEKDAGVRLRYKGTAQVTR